MEYKKSCDPTEIKLIEACIRQDRKAQRELYERFAPRMYSLCLRYISDRDKAKDVLQDGFITLFAKIDTYNGEGSFEGWVRKIFVNTALMDLRKNDVLKGSAEIEEFQVKGPTVENILDKLQAKDIYRLISTMPQGFRTVFNLYVVDGYSHQEIAERLGISEGSSRSQLSRGRVWLQEKINKLEK